MVHSILVCRHNIKTTTRENSSMHLEYSESIHHPLMVTFTEVNVLYFFIRLTKECYNIIVIILFEFRNFFLKIHCNPSLAHIDVRDLQNSQLKASVQSLLLAGNSLYNQYQPSAGEGELANFREFLKKNTIFYEHPVQYHYFVNFSTVHTLYFFHRLNCYF